MKATGYTQSTGQSKIKNHKTFDLVFFDLLHEAVSV